MGCCATRGLCHRHKDLGVGGPVAGMHLAALAAGVTLIAPIGAVPNLAAVASASPPSAVQTVVVKGKGARTTPAFGVAAKELIVAFVSSGGGTVAHQAKGDGLRRQGLLAWSLAERSSGQAGDTEIWTARAAKALSQVKVTSTQSIRSGLPQSVTIVVFKGAQGVGGASAAVSSTGSPAGVPSISFTSTVADSLAYGVVGFDPVAATARTFAPGQAKVSEWTDAAAGETAWVQRPAVAGRDGRYERHHPRHRARHGCVGPRGGRDHPSRATRPSDQCGRCGRAARNRLRDLESAVLRW